MENTDKEKPRYSVSRPRFCSQQCEPVVASGPWKRSDYEGVTCTGEQKGLGALFSPEQCSTPGGAPGLSARAEPVGPRDWRGLCTLQLCLLFLLGLRKME